MNLEMSCPSKSFLLGEYLVLENGEALIANTRPRFHLKVSSRGQGTCSGIHPKSPAGLWFQGHAKDFSKFNLSFEDPHQGAGGLGASSAQYLMTYLAREFLSGNRPEINSTEFVRQAWEDYQKLLQDTGGRPPSGADVVAQWSGGLSLLGLHRFQAQNLRWNFQDQSFFVLRTGRKLATHEHLSELGKFNWKPLKEQFDRAKLALVNVDKVEFGGALNEYGRSLFELGFCADESHQMVEQIQKSNLVLGAKACGAMGADMLFVFFEKENISALQSLLESLNLSVVASHEDLSEGLKVVAEPNREITKGPWL